MADRRCKEGGRRSDQNGAHFSAHCLPYVNEILTQEAASQSLECDDCFIIPMVCRRKSSRLVDHQARLGDQHVRMGFTSSGKNRPRAQSHQRLKSFQTTSIEYVLIASTIGLVRS